MLPTALCRALFVLGVLCLGSWTHAQAIPQDEDGFAKWVAERVGRDLADFGVQPVGRLTLEGKRADGESTGSLSLDRLHAFCQREAGRCAEATEHFAKGVTEQVRERSRPIERAMVRLVVRPQSYVDQILQKMGEGAILSRPLTPELAIVPVLDFTRSVRFVSAKNLATLGLTQDQVFMLGEGNLRAGQKPLAEVAKVPADQALGSITGEDYASSRILFHADWKDLSGKLNQQLVVMIPAPDILLYGDGSTPMSLEALKTLGLNMARQSQRPLSPLLLRWTEGGWESVK
jgi:uncharacterized protein YtpQ (UPF0354 family)